MTGQHDDAADDAGGQCNARCERMREEAKSQRVKIFDSRIREAGSLGCGSVWLVQTRTAAKTPGLGGESWRVVGRHTAQPPLFTHKRCLAHSPLASLCWPCAPSCPAGQARSSHLCLPSVRATTRGRAQIRAVHCCMRSGWCAVIVTVFYVLFSLVAGGTRRAKKQSIGRGRVTSGTGSAGRIPVAAPVGPQAPGTKAPAGQGPRRPTTAPPPPPHPAFCSR